MSLTNKQRIFWAIYASCLVVFTYFLLVAGDWILYARLGNQDRISSEKYADARLIEGRRASLQDFRLREWATDAGYEPLFYPNLLEEDRFRVLAEKHGVAPLAPQPNSSIYYCNEGYGLLTFDTDRFGFRNDDALWDAPVDIAVIGDSFVQGACVRGYHAITGNLMGEYKSLNLGVSSSGPLHYAAVAKIFVPKVRPRIAIMVFYPNDNGHGDEEDFFFRAYFSGQKGYYQSNNGEHVSPDLEAFYQEAVSMLRLEAAAISADASPKYLERNLSNQPDVVGKGSQAHDSSESVGAHFELQTIFRVLSNFGQKEELAFSSRLAIDTLLETCRNNGCKPIFVYIPNSRFWRPDARADAYAESIQQYIDGRAPFVDTRDAIRSIGAYAYAVEGPHLSPYGYAAVANEIKSRIQESAED